MAESFTDKNGLKVEEHSANHTVAAADSGVVQLVDTTSTHTLPATAVGDVYIFQAAKSGVGITINPAAADNIRGGGLTATDDKDLILTAATARAGDFVKLVADGVHGYTIAEISGTWVKQS